MAENTRWGQRRNLGPQWLENVPIVLLDLRTLEEPTELSEPQVLNIALAANFLGAVDVASNAAFRWQILAGSGGTAKEWLLDARAFQQVSLSAASVKVSLVANRSFLDTAFGRPNVMVDAAALVAVGSTSTEQATYTQMFRSSGALTFITARDIPAGASSFRLIGSSPAVAAAGPFQATVDVILNQGPFPVLALEGPELLETLKAGAFITLPGGIDSLEVDNGTGVDITNWGIQWGLDL